MSILQQVLDFLQAQWPALILLAYNYWQSRAIRAENQVKADALQSAIEAAHAKIDAHYNDMSSGDIVDAASGLGTSSTSKSDH